VAGSFFQLLVLKSHNYVDLKQPEPYADITITRTAQFDEPLAAPS
jgi:chromatin segregation and condensation protein Rec8/ScpA/Scc1 (kleisin family)